MAHSGWAKVLTKAGYKIVHEHSDRHTFSKKDSVRTIILDKDGVEVIRLEQDREGVRGGGSLYGAYREAAYKLGIVERRRHGQRRKRTEYDDCPETQVELEVERKSDPPHEIIVFRHPSFGKAVLGRYYGGSKQFMSPIVTNGGFSLRIYSAELSHDVDLGTDRVFENKPLCEIEMSFTQFAELITAAGQGDGVPVTIRYIDGIEIEPCELPTAMERLEENVQESMATGIADLKALMTELEEEMTGSGYLSSTRKKEIYQKLRDSLGMIATKSAWLMEQWHEQVDKVMIHAKSEFAHWARGFVSSGGIKSIEEGKIDESTKAIGGSE